MRAVGAGAGTTGLAMSCQVVTRAGGQVEVWMQLPGTLASLRHRWVRQRLAEYRAINADAHILCYASFARRAPRMRVERGKLAWSRTKSGDIEWL